MNFKLKWHAVIICSHYFFSRQFVGSVVVFCFATLLFLTRFLLHCGCHCGTLVCIIVHADNSGAISLSWHAPVSSVFLCRVPSPPWYCKPSLSSLHCGLLSFLFAAFCLRRSSRIVFLWSQRPCLVDFLLVSSMKLGQERMSLCIGKWN